MKVYSSREVAALLGMSIPQVRAQARAGFLRPERGPRRAYRFSFQDLVLLRAARSLSQERIPSRRIRRALRRLRKQVPQDQSLTEIRIVAEGGKIVVRDGAAAWNPDSGQLQLDFKVSRRAGPPRNPVRPRPADSKALDADDHVSLGQQLYRENEIEESVDHYRKALGLRRNHPTAAFNLGVALEDLGHSNEAIDAYRRAIENDPYLPDAHYNLARLYEKAGKKTAAVRHLKSYRELIAGKRGGGAAGRRGSGAGKRRKRFRS
jgi:tetratricopeptide (TPR) repeat protein